MKRFAGIAILALATTVGMAQNDKTGAGFGVNAQGSQKITNGPVIEYVSDHSAMIAWSTKKPAGTYIAYGTDQNNLSQKATAPWGGTNHRAEIKGLNPSTTYFFQVRSENAGNGGKGADVESPVASFTTVAKGAAPDKQNKNVGVNGSNAAPEMAQAMPQSDQGANSSHVALYRLSSPARGFFYTTDPNERNSAAANGYAAEGAVGYVSATQVESTVPLYALVNSAGDHFYTTNPQENQQLQRDGVRSSGVVGYVPPTQTSDTIPLYRILSQNGSHIFTTSQQERSQLLQGGAKDEGIACYLWKK